MSNANAVNSHNLIDLYEEPALCVQTIGTQGMGIFMVMFAHN